MDQPEEYARSNSLQYRHVCDLIEEFPEEFKNMHGRIIDIGCGPGNITKDLLLPNVEEDAIIIGADISASMVEYAEQHNAMKNKLSYLQLDIQTCKLPDNLIGQFDNAVSFYCLHWCRNTKLTMGNFYKLLRPGGKAIVLLISYQMIFDIYLEQHNNEEFSAYMQDTLKFIPPHHGHQNPEEMMKKDLKEVGFKILYCSKKWKTFTYPKLDTFLDLMMAVNPFFKRMPDDLRKEYRKDVGKRLMNKDPSKKKNEDSNNCSFECPISLLTAVFEKPRD